MKILFTGFEPFGANQRNPTAELVANLHQRPPAGLNLTAEVLPVDTHLAPQRLLDLLETVRPEMILLTGLAAGRTSLSLERVALNLLDFEIPDNAGLKIQDRPIEPEGPAAYFSTLPVRPLMEQMLAAGLPAMISNTAGAYLCNQVFYQALHWAAQQDPPPAVGFLHVPQLADPDTAGQGLTLEQMRDAIQIILEKTPGFIE